MPRTDHGPANLVSALPSMNRTLPLELLRARELILRRFRPLLHTRDITEQQWRVLRVIVEQGACSMQVLAGACCIHPPSLSRMIPKLLARGLLQRRSDLRDQRRAEISITADGRAFHDAITQEVVEVYAQLDAELGRERIDHVLATVSDLVEALGGTAAFLSGPDDGEEGQSNDNAA